MKPILPFAQYDEATNHLHILHKNIPDGVTNLYTEEFVRKQQAEMDIVIKLLCGEQISDDLMMHWNPLHSTLKNKLLKAQE